MLHATIDLLLTWEFGRRGMYWKIKKEFYWKVERMN